MVRVEKIQAIQKIGTRTTESSEGEDALPPHLVSVLDTASALTSDQRARAATLLAKHVYTFPAPGSPITSRTDAVVHEIDTGSTRPMRYNPRKLSPKKIKIQQELVDKMLEDGQIEPSDSAWSAPTVLVTKKDGSTRFCVDYRRLNARTKKDAFPLPRIDDSLNSLSGQAWFSTLDLASGYWQVSFSENAKPGGGYETIQLHRFHAAMECFAETVDTISIPPHSEVMLWAKLKTNNGRRGPTAGVVLALQTFVQ